jgi:hypothetical protein
MRLEGRDRKLAILAAGLIVLWLGWLFWVSPALERAAQAEEQIGRKERQLKELMTLRARWDGLKVRRAALEERVSRRGKEFNLTALLQEAASRAGVAANVKAANETPPVLEGRYRRRALELRLEELTLEQFVNYIYEVDDPKSMIRIDRLEVRPRADNPYYLDVNLTVSSIDAITSPEPART